MKQYRLNVEPRILEMLGPNLYTNIYCVFAELIANAYDADARNAYIKAVCDAMGYKRKTRAQGALGYPRFHQEGVRS